MSRFPRALVFGLIGSFGIAYAVFAKAALHAFPFSGDEYSYLLQAQIFARGLLHTAALAHPELLRVDHVVMDSLVRSKYPPGTSALLALGVRAGMPWIVTPVEGALTLALVWKATQSTLGERPALVAVLLLGLSPLFFFQSASFYSHTPAMMWLAVSFVALAQWTLDRRSLWLVLVGAALGSAFVTRPLDALLFGAALLSFRSLRVVLIAIAGVLPFVALTLAYQNAQFGSPFADGYHLYAATFPALDGVPAVGGQLSLRYAVDGAELWNHLDVCRAFLLEWMVPGTAILALLGWSRLRVDAKAAPMLRFCLTVIVAFSVVLLLTTVEKDDGARARYLSPTLIPIVWLAGTGWGVAGDFLREKVGRRAPAVVGALLGVVAILEIGAFFDSRVPKQWVREGLATAVAKAGVAAGVVIVRAEHPTRYARNGPFFDQPVLYVSSPPSVSVNEVAAAFPSRPIFLATEPHGDRWEQLSWQVERLR
jgi:4-amino-4-deoxy-L-arabinose transferase-like glycosyltransferase